ncbi:pantetheine-phosphate adenylyltransferase-like protein [Xylariaceae sp. FL0804]|nr:pantetheine-phosphate adenylyltransferase-like protein [Xylariaceae sp. FL0804]
MADARPSLLLLPPPPRPATRSALQAAYEPPLNAAISKLRDEKDNRDGNVLIAAVLSPVLGGSSPGEKSLSWPEAQSVLAGLYSIIAVICARKSIATDLHAGPGSVDVRVVLVDHDPSSPAVADFKPAIEPNNTVIVDLATFASAYHSWKYVFHISNEPGYQILSAYLKMVEGAGPVKQDQLIVVDGGLSLNLAAAGPAHASSPTKLHHTVCLGGTFDHLHPGHKLLLTAAVLLLNVPERGTPDPCRFIVGVTGDELLKRKKYAEFVQSWDERATNIIEFLSSVLHLPTETGSAAHRGPDLARREGEVVARFRDGTVEVQCVVIQDAFGPTITTEDMDALVVSGETRSGGRAVNERREALGWRPLEIFEVDVLDADDAADSPAEKTDFTNKISSTAIRQSRAEACK